MKSLIFEIRMYLYWKFIGWAQDVCPKQKRELQRETALFIMDNIDR